MALEAIMMQIMMQRNLHSGDTMITSKLTDNLIRIFKEENRRIVFWNDADGE